MYKKHVPTSGIKLKINSLKMQIKLSTEVQTDNSEHIRTY